MSERPAPSSSCHSESTEDHLERIAQLVEQKGYARVTDLAEQLRLRSSTVSNMVRRLAARGLLNYERYRGFTLTEKGKAVAEQIRARHQTLTEFLTLMGLDAETVEWEVEEIEHHLRPQTLTLLTGLVSFWQAHPSQLAAFQKHRAALEATTVAVPVLEETTPAKKASSAKSRKKPAP